MNLPWLSAFCKPAFVHPCRVLPRTAIIFPGFRAKSPSRTFNPAEDDLSALLGTFSPRSIAAPYSVLLQLAGKLRLDHSVVVLSIEGQPRLSPDQRDYLWTQFGVPVFEQLLDVQGTLLASECEAHAGLHVAASQHGLALDELIDGPCDCGATVMRLPPVFAVTRSCVTGNAPLTLAAHAG